MSSRIIEAVRNNLYSQLTLFLRHEYNFKIRSEPEGYNVLMIALEIKDPKKRFKMFQFLLNHDLVDNMLETDNNGCTVFFRAVINECVDELNLLLKNYDAEIDWTHKDNSGNSLLHHAVNKNNLKILELLLNVCAKYKINVDIPNNENKITPYLLACRLNYSKAAELLLNIGRASKMQADRTVFFDAERWKQEGQVEKFNSYLKSKEYEMSLAKLYGRVKVFNELNHLATTLDTEVYKNPEILPILAKVIIDHDNETGSLNGQSKLHQQAFSKSQSLDNISLSKLSGKSRSATKLPPISLRNSTNSFMYNRNGKLTNSVNYLSNSVSSSSSQTASSPRSSASSTKLSTIYHHRYPTPHRNSTSASDESNNVILSDLNTILKHTMNSLIKQRNNQSPSYNSLLEMTDGRQVENFVASKPDSDAVTTTGSAAPSNHSHHGHGHGHHGHHDGGLDITSVFYAAAMEKTNSYRVTAKINNEPIMPKIVKAPKPKKASSLAIIREESRVSTISKKSSKNSLKKQNSIAGEGLRKLGKPTVKVAH